MSHHAKKQTPKSRTPGGHLANLLGVTTAPQFYHGMTRRMRLKARVVGLAMAGKISPNDAHKALVLSRLVSA